MRTRLLFIALLGLGGLALLFVVARPEVGATSAAVPTQATERVEPEPVVLVAPDTRPAGVALKLPVETEREPVAAPESLEFVGIVRERRRGRREPREPSVPALVPVKVVSTSGVPLLGARVFFKKPGSSLKNWRAAEPVDPEAALAEWVERELPSGHELRVQAVFLAGPIGRAEVDVAVLHPGPNAGLVVTVNTEQLNHFHGRVFDAQGDLPVMGARITVRDPDSSRGREWVLGRRHTLARARTDGEGRFEVQVPDWEGLALEVEAPGYAPRLLTIARGANESTRFERVIELERSAQVTARVLGTGGDPIQGITVRISADVGAGLDEGEEQAEWTSVTDAAGVCYLDGVPTGVALDVECLRLEQVLLQDPESLLLHPGQTASLELALP